MRLRKITMACLRIKKSAGAETTTATTAKPTLLLNSVRCLPRLCTKKETLLKLKICANHIPQQHYKHDDEGGADVPVLSRSSTALASL